MKTILALTILAASTSVGVSADFASLAYIPQMDASQMPQMSMAEIAAPMFKVVEAMPAPRSDRGNLALVWQDGETNTASINQSGFGHVALVRQIGYMNTTAIQQQGVGQQAMVFQQGRGNVAIIRQR